MFEKRIGILELIQIIIVCALFILKVVPQFQYSFAGLIWSLLYQVLFMFWLLLTVICSGIWFRYLKSYFIYVFLWLVVLALEFVLFPNTQIGFLGLNLTFWEPLIIFYYYTEIRNNQKITTIITIVVLIMLFYGIVQSIVTVNVNALAAREASSGHLTGDAVLTGNYSFTAMLTILIPLWVAMLITKQKVYIKIIVAVILASEVFFIFHCNLLISIICMIFSILSLFLFSEKKGISANRVLLFILALLLLYITAFYWKHIALFLLDSLEQMINTKEVSGRITHLRFLINGAMVGNVSSRFELDLIALRTFIKHPIWGIGPQNNADIYYRTALGLHASLFDDIARYGIIGCIILFMAYLSFIKTELLTFNNTMGCRVIKASFVMFIIISMLNPVISANVGIALFFLIPTICKLAFTNNTHDG